MYDTKLKLLQVYIEFVQKQTALKQFNIDSFKKVYKLPIKYLAHNELQYDS